MTEVNGSISRESMAIYDSRLTYEQRAQLRKKRREERARTVSFGGGPGIELASYGLVFLQDFVGCML